MGSDKYNLTINSAKISKDDVAVARTKIRSLLQLQQSQLDKLFSNRPIRLFKDVEYEVAQQYSDAIKIIGLECLIEASSKQQEIPLTPQVSASTPSPLKLEEKVITRKEKSYFCPTCQLSQSSKNICEYCNGNIEIYRDKMKLNGFIEIFGVGYIQERRMMHRRSSAIRREELRLENNSDRRIPEERRKDYGAYQFTR
jgi:hypothetical protein